MRMGFGKGLEIGFKNTIATILRYVFTQPPKIPAPPYRRILILRYDVMGDMVLSLPIFRVFRKTFPDTCIDALCSPKNAGLLMGAGYVNHIYLHYKNPVRTFKLIRKLRKKRYNLIVNLVTRPSFTFGLISRLIGPDAVRIAGDQERFGYFYNRLIELPPKREIHMLKRLFLLNADLIEGEISLVEAPWVKYNQDIKDEAKNLYTRVLESLPVTSNPARIVAMNLSASLTRREWPLEKYTRLLQFAVDKYSDQIDGWAIFTNPQKSGEAQQLARAVANEKVTAIPPHHDFRVIMEFLRHVYLLITPDTSISHAASAMGAPVLVLMIGENITVWNPVGVPHQIVLSKDPFSLRELTVEEVQKKFETLLKLLKSS
jgi:ADP-heptose:LPS heptosyltransferase